MFYSLEFIAKKMVNEIADHAKQNNLAPLPTWDTATEDYKEQSRQAAHRELSKKMTPEDSHTEWHRHMFRNGWTWGPTFDQENKTDPRMVPFSELPEESKFISKIIYAIANLYRDRFEGYYSLESIPGQTNFTDARIETQNIYNR